MIKKIILRISSFYLKEKEHMASDMVSNATEIMERSFGSLCDKSKTYPGYLPANLEPWYCYAKGYGHCIAVVLKSRFDSLKEPTSILDLAPVKTVKARGYEVIDGFIVVDIVY